MESENKIESNSVLSNLKNMLVKNYYSQQDSLFKLIYDKYIRKQVFQDILNTEFSKTNRNKNFSRKEGFTQSATWYKFTSIEFKLDNLSEKEINLEEKSKNFLKYHTFIIKGQFFLYLLSSTTVVTGILFPLVRRNYNLKFYFHLYITGSIMTIIPLNVVILYLVFYPQKNREFLLEGYKNEIKVYDKLFSINKQIQKT